MDVLGAVQVKKLHSTASGRYSTCDIIFVKKEVKLRECKTANWLYIFCFSESLIQAQAKEMVLKGFADVGYEHVIIDDCWLNHTRGEDGKLQEDKDRFPSGIKALANYVSSESK